MSKKVILDTNLWISFLITNNLSEIDRLIYSGQIQIVFFEELMDEFVDVSKRPKFNRYFDNSSVTALLSKFEEFGVFVKVTPQISICRDPKDNFLLDLAIQSNADYLITGDADLLDIQKIQQTKIRNWATFLKEETS